MAILNDYRFKPGTKLIDQFDIPLMVIRLAAGMIRSGDATGGESTVAVVNLSNGVASFEDRNLEVREMS